LKCDNDYWKIIEQEAAERKLFQALQQRYRAQAPTHNPRNPSTTQTHQPQNPHSSHYTPQFPRPKPTGNPGSHHYQPPRPNPSYSPVAGPSRPAPTPPTQPPSKPRPSHLGPDGRLTASERQRRMDNGLCLICAQKGHMAAECPSARYKPSGTPGTPPRPPKGRRAKADSKAAPPQEPAESK
jgi:hypothetical protein